MKKFLDFIKHFRKDCFDYRLQEALNLPDRKFILFTPYELTEHLCGWIESYKRKGITFDYICTPAESFAKVQQQTTLKVIKLQEFKKNTSGGGGAILYL